MVTLKLDAECLALNRQAYNIVTEVKIHENSYISELRVF